jgi:hypothetical protein
VVEQEILVLVLLEELQEILLYFQQLQVQVVEMVVVDSQLMLVQEDQVAEVEDVHLILEEQEIHHQ